MSSTPSSRAYSVAQQLGPTRATRKMCMGQYGLPCHMLRSGRASCPERAFLQGKGEEISMPPGILTNQCPPSSGHQECMPWPHRMSPPPGTMITMQRPGNRTYKMLRFCNCHQPALSWKLLQRDAKVNSGFQSATNSSISSTRDNLQQALLAHAVCFSQAFAL